MNARVSIIIPMFNAARYIIETLESVRCQTYKRYELFIVDDGSSDSSVETVQRFISEIPSFATLLFHPQNENRGTSASRNLGLSHANGELICFLDSDDLWAPDFLDYFVNIFDNYTDLSMAYGPALLWWPNGDKSRVAEQRLGIKANRIIDPIRLFKLFITGQAETPSPSGVMIKYSTLCEVGGWEDKFRGMYDDQVLYSKILLHEKNVFVADQCLYRYRQHEDSISKTSLKYSKDTEYRLIYLEWLKQYLTRRGQLSEYFNITIIEHLWYVQCHQALKQLPSNGYVIKKVTAINYLITFLLQQKNVMTFLKLGCRISKQNVINVVNSITFKLK